MIGAPPLVWCLHQSPCLHSGWRCYWCLSRKVFPRRAQDKTFFQRSRYEYYSLHMQWGVYGILCLTGSGFMCNRVYQMVNIYLKYGESKRVTQLVLVNDEGASATALHVDTGEGVQLRVHPVEPLVQQVWGGGRGGGGATGQARVTTGTHEWIKKSNLKPERHEWWCLPSVIPLGHTMLSVTRAVRSAPFRPPFSILAGFPQSVQYMKLGKQRYVLWK